METVNRRLHLATNLAMVLVKSCQICKVRQTAQQTLFHRELQLKRELLPRQELQLHRRVLRVQQLLQVLQVQQLLQVLQVQQLQRVLRVQLLQRVLRVQLLQQEDNKNYNFMLLTAKLVLSVKTSTREDLYYSQSFYCLPW
ncbi:uncharacterized protein LOC106648312 [Trichogramma pretiosum]|uniref:uncharacterized protein LOC106648312 n=1 Tax=Trichogramma pretiosum TaxID=7493 RepID=UPI0006C97597|nr:uncharacterized protein LOC106648312 [Trichogramma pretiosum]